MKKNIKPLLLSVFILSGLVFFSCRKQSKFVALVTVKDQSGNFIKGATVSISKGQLFDTQTTNDKGQSMSEFKASGKYEITVVGKINPSKSAYGKGEIKFGSSDPRSGEQLEEVSIVIY